MNLQLELDDIKKEIKTLNATKLALVQSNAVEVDEQKKLVNAATLVEFNDLLKDHRAFRTELLQAQTTQPATRIFI